MKRTLAEFAQLCGGRLQGADAAFSDVVTDTRTLKRGQLIVALTGPNFSGGSVGAALTRGAAGRGRGCAAAGAHCRRSIVPDTQAALERAARASARAFFDGPLVGVAGSNGKTSTKEMTAAILAQAGDCLATRGNLNNHIGVPLTLLRLSAAHRFAVIEMGANRAGEVAALVALARPSIGLITNAGAEHLEGFGSLEGVARAEGEMVAGLTATATAVINADDQFGQALWRSCTPARVVTFGVTSAADLPAPAKYAPRSGLQAFAPSSASPPGARQLRQVIEACALAARTTSPMPWRLPRPPPVPARRSRTSRRASPACAPCPGIACSSSSGRRRLASSMIPTTPTPSSVRARRSRCSLP